MYRSDFDLDVFVKGMKSIASNMHLGRYNNAQETYQLCIRLEQESGKELLRVAWYKKTELITTGD